MSARENRRGAKKGDGKGVGKGKKGFEGHCFKCGKLGHKWKDCRSKETSAFEVDEQEPSSETRCFDMASVDLNALEIRSAHVSEGNRKLRIGINSCAAVTVFPENSSRRLHKAPDTRQSKELQAGVGQACARSGCKKGAGQIQRWVSSMREPSSGGRAQSLGGCVGDERHGSRRVLSLERTTRAVARSWSSRANGVFEFPVELVPYERSSSKSSNTGAYSSLSAIEQIGSLMHKICEYRAPKVSGACDAVSLTKSWPSGSCRSNSFGGALRSTRRPSQAGI